MSDGLMMEEDGRAARERRKRNIVLAVVLGALGVLMYLI